MICSDYVAKSGYMEAEVHARLSNDPAGEVMSDSVHLVRKGTLVVLVWRCLPVIKTCILREASGIVERTETMRTLTPCSLESSLHLLVR